MASTVSLTTYNIHKGMSPLNRRLQLPQMVDALQHLDTDILFLQEVQGAHGKRQQYVPEFPSEPHAQIIGRRLAFASSYGQNATYANRHHGNAILSRLPLETRANLNVSVNRLEQRGVLHCEIRPPGWDVPLTCLCVHLNLREADRKLQYRAIAGYINSQIPADTPLILAGDFNDWRHQSCSRFGRLLGLDEAFVRFAGSQPKTFPARLPILSLDRIYTRHLNVLDAMSHQGLPWQLLSDHLPLSAVVELRGC
ncbi:endonuclease/exonuclease/phosphatase family protein [Eikenella sp. S3360]|uniref:Endonuclease/exonuclease/phosphatase family protein n=1 Tax=Eikenella glucosivorans TaxID=2766967 RepID=A0ABS0NDH2_9NEIS|nr:endonuclease/exonuclease/phosphatase family protein [Eikenella glucosivorans]MBH5330326.1 endonuclease/exonuclease/phosphatase family protein [Eikenella glucosivorans]